MLLNVFGLFWLGQNLHHYGDLHVGALCLNGIVCLSCWFFRFLHSALTRLSDIFLGLLYATRGVFGKASLFLDSCRMCNVFSRFYGN